MGGLFRSRVVKAIHDLRDFLHPRLLTPILVTRSLLNDQDAIFSLQMRSRGVYALQAATSTSYKQVCFPRHYLVSK